MEFTKTENILIIYKNRRSKIAAQMNISNMGKVF
jgi:RNA polymerase subunit RPABC4/transcription elongation factor Spt4